MCAFKTNRLKIELGSDSNLPESGKGEVKLVFKEGNGIRVEGTEENYADEVNGGTAIEVKVKGKQGGGGEGESGEEGKGKRRRDRQIPNKVNTQILVVTCFLLTSIKCQCYSRMSLPSS